MLLGIRSRKIMWSDLEIQSVLLVSYLKIIRVKDVLVEQIYLLVLFVIRRAMVMFGRENNIPKITRSK